MADKIVQLHDEANNNIYPVTTLDAIHGSGALRADFVLKQGDTMTGPLTATKFIGPVQGNADSATLTNYIKTSVAADNANRHVLFAFNGDSVGKQRVVIDDDFKYNPSTNTLTIANVTGNAATASSAAQLTTARTIRTNLASTSTASFNGTANITPGVTGILPVANGGTGLSALVTPTVTWTAGTTAGPKVAIKDSLGKSATAVAIPSASGSASGVVTTGAQTFAGTKTFTGDIKISHTTNATMDATTTNPRITFSESGSQEVGLVYTDYNNYRSPAGLKVIGIGADSAPAWFEAEGNIYGSAIYGAVWNDYAEFRICNEDFKPGQVVLENGDDTLSIADKRLQRGCSIVSDTFGFAIGETDEAKCPIAVSGRVLAYGYESREEFKKHIGWPVCSGPNGTVSIMTEEEEEKYPSRIIGTISAVPDYETWGTGNVEVNNRIWIKIK